MAGRKPKPTALKKLEGNPGKRKLNTKEPMPGKGMPDCPKWLLPEAKKEWERLCVKLSEMGVLTEIDMANSTLVGGEMRYRQKYLIRWIKRDEGGKMVYDKTNTPRYFTAQDLNEQMGIDVVLPNEIRVAEMYENPVICGKVIRILEDEEFPMRQEYRKACELLDKLRKKYEKKEPAEDILARFH